jgi:hypothetical protein
MFSTNSKIKQATGQIFSGSMLQMVNQIHFLTLCLEHFIVWMRTAGLPTFRKLYGVINQDLEPGTYYLNIYNNYDVSSFDGTKTFVISTTNSLGGQNYFLSIAYIVVGVICIVLSIFFYSIHEKQQS